MIPSLARGTAGETAIVCQDIELQDCGMAMDTELSSLQVARCAVIEPSYPWRRPTLQKAPKY